MVGIEVRAGFIGSIRPTERSQGNNPSVAGTSNPVQGSGLVWRQGFLINFAGFMVLVKSRMSYPKRVAGPFNNPKKTGPKAVSL